MSSTLAECEREVEQTRAKLARDLATLRSPQTFSSFTDDLKQDAFETKDALVEKIRSSAESGVAGVISDIKAKAAENPAAVLAIAAGIGWRLIRNPPIATALVGIGLYSLWTTEANAEPSSDEELVERSKQRLKQQISTATAGAKGIAAEAGLAVAAKAGEAADAAQKKLDVWTDQGRRSFHDEQDAIAEGALQMADRIRAAGGGVSDAAQQQAAQVTARVQEATDQVRGAVNRTMDQAGEQVDDFVQQGVKAVSRAADGLQTRDQILLGVAGLAVAAAVGIASQRRATEDE
jgi:hypothetical protein